MSLLPVPRPESWEHTDLAEAHAVALATPVPPDEQGRTLLRLFRLAMLRQQAGRADRILTDAARLVAASADPVLRRALAAERLRWQAGRLRTLDEAEGIDATGRELLRDCPDSELGTRARLLFCVGYAAAWTAQPERLSRAGDLLSEAVGLFRVLDEPELQAEALLVLGYLVYAAQRLYDRAITALERSIGLLPEGSSARGVQLTYLAECRAMVGDLGRAAAELTEAHAIGTHHGDERLIGYAAWELARICDLQGDPAGCDRWIAQAQQHPGDWYRGKAGNEFLADTVLWAFRQGRDDLARERYALLADRGEGIGEGQDLGVRGLIDLLDGRPQDAVAAIGRHLDLGWQEPRRWHWQVLLADAALAAGRRDLASELAAEVRHDLTGIGHPELAGRLEPERWARVSALLDPPPPSIRLVLFGGAAVEQDGVRRPLPEGHPAALAGVLAMSSRPLEIDEVCDALWPDVDLVLARQRLRNVVARVRRVAAIVERTPEGLRLDPAVTVDAVDFERSVRSLGYRGADLSPQALREALARCGGTLLPGVAGERIDAYRRHYQQLAAEVRRRLVTALADAGDPAAAADEAERLLALEPFDEPIAWQIARAFAQAGDGAAARAWEERGRQIAASLEG